MSNLTYSLYSGDQRVTEDLQQPITDLGLAKQLAAELSQKQPGEAITVSSRQRGGAEMTSTVGRFLNGEEVPWRWRVDFFGYLEPGDDLALSKAGILVEDKRSEVAADGSIRTGLARNVVLVEADTGNAAVAMVKDALRAPADEYAEWHYAPA